MQLCNETVIIFCKADLSQYYHMTSLEYIKTAFSDYFEEEAELTDEETGSAADLYHIFKLLKIIDDNLIGVDAPVSTSADSARSAKLQHINSLAHELTITNKNFLTEFCARFTLLENTDDIGAKLTLLFDLFDVEKARKRLDYLSRSLRSDSEDDEDESNMGSI